MKTKLRKNLLYESKLKLNIKTLFLILILINNFHLSNTKFNIENYKDKNLEGITNLNKNTKNGAIQNFRFSQKEEGESNRFDNLENFVQKKVKN